MSAVINEPAPADTASPPRPAAAATRSPAEIPYAGFDDMGLRVGDRMQLVPHPGVRCEPYIVRLIGYVRDLSLIVSAPPAGWFQAPVIEGDSVVMRVFSGRSAFGFECRVDKVIKLPFEYLHLSFPRTIASRVIRKSRRVKCDIPVVVNGGTAQATISNLSSTGAEICSDAALGEPGSTVGLAFAIKVHDSETQVAANATIRSSKGVAAEGKSVWRSGVEFADLSVETGMALKNLIYQELIERPQSLL